MFTNPPSGKVNICRYSPTQRGIIIVAVALHEAKNDTRGVPRTLARKNHVLLGKLDCRFFLVHVLSSLLAGPKGNFHGSLDLELLRPRSCTKVFWSLTKLSFVSCLREHICQKRFRSHLLTSGLACITSFNFTVLWFYGFAWNIPSEETLRIGKTVSY